MKKDLRLVIIMHSSSSALSRVSLFLAKIDLKNNLWVICRRSHGQFGLIYSSIPSLRTSFNKFLMQVLEIYQA